MRDLDTGLVTLVRHIAVDDVGCHLSVPPRLLAARGDREVR